MPNYYQNQLFIIIFSIGFHPIGFDSRGGRFYEEEDSACPALLEREFHSLHRNVPGLRRAGVDTNAIRQVGYLLFNSLITVPSASTHLQINICIPIQTDLRIQKIHHY